ncbi:MAG: arylesterase [Gemmatimonadota bacterium]
MIPSAGRIPLTIGLLLLASCGEKKPAATNEAGDPLPAAPGPAPADATMPTIVFVGTSLTAGYGLPDPSLAYPALIQRKIDSLGLKYRVVNRGVSGETSAGALARIDWVLSQGPVAVLVIETGANDGLRGQDPESMKRNIRMMMEHARKRQPPPVIVLVGMEAMPNLGETYAARFRAIYPELARENSTKLVPFLLEGVAGVDSLNQPDGIHPTAKGAERVAETVWRVLEGVVRP